MKKKDEMPCSITDGDHFENPDENWYDLMDVLYEITRSLHPMALEVIENKETKKWEKQ